MQTARQINILSDIALLCTQGIRVETVNYISHPRLQESTMVDTAKRGGQPLRNFYHDPLRR